MKIAILYICTGRYAQFFHDFYQSAKQYFLTDEDKTFFVFTDQNLTDKSDDIRIIPQACKGFPMDSLLRFDYFLSIQDELKDFDYTFFFNANMLFVSPVDKEFLPQKGLMAVLHPGYYNKPSFLFPYERNKKSTAYITPFETDYHYYMGGLNGGTTKEYLILCQACSQQIHMDLDHNIMAIYHDESHLNRYLRTHKCRICSPAYGYPEGKQLPFEPKIIIRDKVKISAFFDKSKGHSLLAKFKKALHIVLHAIKWYI